MYRYVGPAELWTDVGTGQVIATVADLEAWLTAHSDEAAEPFTFVVDTAGQLRLAHRRSEHVACAGGEPVLCAGEIRFGATMEVSNQSTGYCPDVGSWPAVAAALDRIGVDRPAGFTHPIVFRLCAGCGERNIVRDDHYVCVFCDRNLPVTWNLG